MRSPQLLTCLLTCACADAQLINGSFESGSTGWTVPCDCAPAYPTPGGAPGAGSQCLGLDNVHFDCLCMILNSTEQLTPWVSPGTWVLSGWIKSAVPGDVPGSFIRLSAGPAFSGQNLINLASSTGDWEFVSGSVMVDNFVDTDSLRISLVPDDGNEQPPSICYFDNIQLTAELNTAIAENIGLPPAFRPNPTADKLWIDLQTAPISITAIDAIGRNVPLQTFHRTGHTLEVDVSSIPPGPCVLILNTSSGNRTIRFIKT